MSRQEDLRGIALMTAAMAGFAASDAGLKAVSGALPVGQMLLAYGAGGALCLLLVARARRVAVWTREAWLPPVVLRNAAEMVATVCILSALARIPLSTATAVLQATPVVYLALAGPVLGLRVTARQRAAVACGLLGVLLIVRPGLAGFDAGALWAVGGVAALALRDLATRKVPGRVPTLALAVWGFAALVPVGLVWTAWAGSVVPGVREQALLAVAVLCGVAAYLAVTAALRTGDPGAVTPFRYTRMVFGMGLGLAVFGEAPDAPTLAGAALVVLAGLSVLRR